MSLFGDDISSLVEVEVEDFMSQKNLAHVGKKNRTIIVLILSLMSMKLSLDVCLFFYT